MNFSITNEKIKDKYQKYLSNKNKPSNENSLNYSEFTAYQDKSINNLNLSVGNINNSNLDQHRNFNFLNKDGTPTAYQFKENSKTNISDMSNNNFLSKK